MKTIYRAATPADHPAWIALRVELWPDCPQERHALEVAQISSSPGIVAVAQCREALVGFAEVSIRRDHVEGTAAVPVPYLEGWYVQAPFRGQGIGRGLLAFVEDWARASGFGELASDAELANRYSIALHNQLGFVEVGRSVHFVKKL
jgi:aminoglycoside 6'-N-acetyltransferase I